MSTDVKTTCPYCGVGCGVIAKVDSQGGVTIKGDPDHPANYGRLCSKGTALAETIDLDGRLLVPEINGEPVSWNTALETVASRLTSIIAEHGPEAVAFYVSGQLLTEDYYVANKLMKGYIGSANIDTNSRLCMSSAVAGYKRAFGSDTVPCEYEDIDHAELITLVGSNTAWCHPVVYQRIAKAKKANPELKVVLIDPRRTATADIADLHLPLIPGSDGFLFAGLLVWLAQNGLLDSRFTLEHCEGVEEALVAAARSVPDLAAVAERCGLSVSELEPFFRWFGTHERSLTLYSQGINQSSSGTDKANAIINCHLLTGRIGRAGMGPFSVTGQPNAMGGREVGGLANQLAAHMEIGNREHRALVSEFWQAPNLCQTEGLKAVDLFRAIEAEQVKAVWIMATNPAVSLPEADLVREALRRCELVVASDVVARSDTLDLAHIKLPALAWGEKRGSVTNSERCISRQRAFLPTPGEARADWWIIAEVAKRMGFASGFNWQNEAEIFSEYAALTAFRNQGSRDLDLGALVAATPTEYEQFVPQRWPCAELDHGQPRLFADGHFFTPSGRARLIAVEPRAPAQRCDTDYPYLLNTGRSRDHWHTMTRTAKSPRLSRHTQEPFVAINPKDAEPLRVEDQDLLELRSRHGSAVLRVVVSDAQPRGQLFAPIHWSDQFSSSGRIGALVAAITDPVSGQPESKQTPVSLRSWSARWHGFLLSRRQLDLPCGYWSSSRGKGLWRYQLGGQEQPDDWAAIARRWLCAEQRDVGWVEYVDHAQSCYRAARLVQGELESCLYIGVSPQLPDYDWIEPIFLQGELQREQRLALLSGEPLRRVEDRGPTVCACFGVGRNQIEALIASGEVQSVEQITARLQAGGNCGSCLPELKQLLQAKLSGVA